MLNSPADKVGTLLDPREVTEAVVSFVGMLVICVRCETRYVCDAGMKSESESESGTVCRGTAARAKA